MKAKIASYATVALLVVIVLSMIFVTKDPEGQISVKVPKFKKNAPVQPDKNL